MALARSFTVAALAATMSVSASVPDPIKDCPAASPIKTFSDMMFVGPMPLQKFPDRGSCGQSAWLETVWHSTAIAPVNSAFPDGVPGVYDIHDYLFFNRDFRKEMANDIVIFEDRCNTAMNLPTYEARIHMMERCTADFSKACLLHFVSMMLPPR